MRRWFAACALAVLAGTLALAPARSQEPPFTRVSGDDRIATAIAISQVIWIGENLPATTVLLARSDDFPDALAGSPLADLTGAPILLTPSDQLDPRVLAEIERLGAQFVFLLGGPAALDPAVGSALPSNVTGYRFSGSNRYETAALIDQVMNDAGGTANRTDAVVASGQRFPDALMAANLLPTRILLSRQDRFEHYEPRYTYTLVGGPAVLDDAILAQTGGTRLAGEDRYATAADVLAATVGSRASGPLFLATGRTAPDALAAGPAAAHTFGYLMIVDPVLGPTAEQVQVLADNAAQFTELFVLGGPQALPDEVATQVADLIAPAPEPTPTPTPTATPTDEPTDEPTEGPTDG